MRGHGSSLLSVFFPISCYTSLFSLFLSFSIKKNPSVSLFRSLLSLSKTVGFSLSVSLLFFSVSISPLLLLAAAAVGDTAGDKAK